MDPATIRYRKLGYVELMVTDLERSAAFYREIVGLQPAGRGPAGEYRFKCSDDPYAVVLHQADQPGFKRGGWMLEDERQFEALHQRLDGHGVRHEALGTDECRARGLARATRMVEPNTGATMEFYVLPPGTRSEPFAVSIARIQRLGHVVWTTPRHREAIAFFRDVLNFAQSDSIGEMITFFRAFPNPYHHGIGIAQGRERKFNHLNFMVTEIDDVGRGLARFRARDVPVVFGPGRHPASTSVFLYFLDPDGMTLEYSFGMEEFPELGPRAPRRLDPTPINVDVWGSFRDPRMSTVGEIASHTIAGEAR
ncbi:MAG TPA: VOC family protein [Reyranella sp.]|nr:VOC family protein [Reyranella sp.]